MSHLAHVRCILTDIEGTTTSISFVYDILFPYFRAKAHNWKDNDSAVFNDVLLEAKNLVFEEQGLTIEDNEGLINQMLKWSVEDRKVRPLKNFQGLVWETGYVSGEILGHVYPDVQRNLQRWFDLGLSLSVFSSGSVQAQKLIFGFSEAGNLCPYFTNYYDTNFGPKRESDTYHKIAKDKNMDPESILFLSDITEELIAADAAGYKTIQLVRPGNTPNWTVWVESFDQIK